MFSGNNSQNTASGVQHILDLLEDGVISPAEFQSKLDVILDEVLATQEVL